jgi:hypothetical protein
MDPSLGSSENSTPVESPNAIPPDYEGKHRSLFKRPDGRPGVIRALLVEVILIAFLTFVGYAGLNGTKLHFILSSLCFAFAALFVYGMWRGIHLIFTRHDDPTHAESLRRMLPWLLLGTIGAATVAGGSFGLAHRPLVHSTAQNFVPAWMPRGALVASSDETCSQGFAHEHHLIWQRGDVRYKAGYDGPNIFTAISGGFIWLVVFPCGATTAPPSSAGWQNVEVDASSVGVLDHGIDTVTQWVQDGRLLFVDARLPRDQVLQFAGLQPRW